MRAIIYRVFLTILNIFFPPLSVLMLTGPETDTLISCCLFLCGVIPSHVHGFYISCTYFHRRKKVRTRQPFDIASCLHCRRSKKGIFPGGLKPLIYSHNVINGGATDSQIDAIWRRQNGMGKRRSSRRAGSRNPARQGTQRFNDTHAGNGHGMNEFDDRARASGRYQQGMPEMSSVGSRTAHSGYGRQPEMSSKHFSHQNGYTGAAAGDARYGGSAPRGTNYGSSRRPS